MKKRLPCLIELRNNSHTKEIMQIKSMIPHSSMNKFDTHYKMRVYQ